MENNGISEGDFSQVSTNFVKKTPRFSPSQKINEAASVNTSFSSAFRYASSAHRLSRILRSCLVRRLMELIRRTTA